jgi:hypothetical protein
MERSLAEGFLRSGRLEEMFRTETVRLRRFEDELNPVSGALPDLAAVLVSESVRRLERTTQAVMTAPERVRRMLEQLAFDFGIHQSPREREPARREARLLYGSFFIEVEPLRRALRRDEHSIAETAESELRRFPNHPYQLAQSKDVIIRALCLSALANSKLEAP